MVPEVVYILVIGHFYAWKDVCGGIMSFQPLVTNGLSLFYRLRNISKQMSGQYVCSAANVEGDGFSKPQLITVNYKPVCISSTINHQPKEEDGGQGVELLCQVDSKPKSFTYR